MDTCMDTCMHTCMHACKHARRGGGAAGQDVKSPRSDVADGRQQCPKSTQRVRSEEHAGLVYILNDVEPPRAQTREEQREDPPL